MGKQHSSAAESLESEFIKCLAIICLSFQSNYKFYLPWGTALLFEEIKVLVPFVSDNLQRELINYERKCKDSPCRR